MRARHALASLLLPALASASPQTLDVVSSPPSGGSGFGAHLPRPSAGAPKLQLWDNGPYITQTGVGFGGADVSEVEPGLIAYGIDHQFSLGNRLANDFDVPTGQVWTLNKLRWVAYEVGAATTGTITGIYTDYTSASPNGTVIGGNTTTNRFVSGIWTGVYRVTSTTLTDPARALIEVTAAIPPNLGPLGTGKYWVRVMCDGSPSFTGPWGPMTVPWDSSDNAQLEIGLGNGFNPTTAGVAGAPVDNVFWLDGTTNSSSLTTYCTSKPSSLPMCTPAVTASGVSDCNAGSGFVLKCAPVPGGNLGIFLYTTNGMAGSPISTAFGFLCVNPGAGLYRVPLNASSGGAVGACNGAYVLDFNYHFATQVVDPALVCAATVDGQFWYRDPPNVGGANFSLAVQFNMPAGSPPNPPTISSFTPTGGGEGTVLTVSGAGFGTIITDLKVLLADGIGFADVTAASGNSLTATVFAVGATGNAPITVVVGSGVLLPPRNVFLSGINSTSVQNRMILNGVRGSSAGSFNLAPSSPDTLSDKFGGSPISGTLSLPMSSVTPGQIMDIQLAFRIGAGEMRTFESRITFPSMPSATQMAEHLAEQLEQNFGGEGLTATAGGTNVRVSMASANYASTVIKVY